MLAAVPSDAAVLVGVRSANLSWAASSGAVAGYVVLASRNGGPATAQGTTGADTRQFRVRGEYGDSLVVRIVAYGTGADGALETSTPSEPSEPIVFQEAASWPSSDAFALHCGPCGRIRVAILGAPDFRYEFEAMPAPWQPFGIGAVAGSSGSVEIAWRNPQTGQLLLTRIDPAAGRIPVAASTTSGMTAREALGVADIDGDGRDEILMRNTGNGYFERWSFTSSGITRLSSHAVPAGWTWVDVHDFDGDGTEEVIWLGDSDDLRISGWDRGSFVATLEQHALDLPGVPVQVADFDGNGAADVLVRDALGGLSIAYFDAQGLDREVAMPLPPAVTFLVKPTRVWAQIDGKAGMEIVGRNQSDGSIFALVPAPESTPSWAKLFDVDADWKPFARLQ